MNTVKQILDVKGYEVWTISKDVPVFDAIKLMAEKEVGAIIVKDGDKVVGIISERDYARNIILKGRSSQQTLVKEIMTPRVIYVLPNQRAEECMALMTENKIRHLPVLDGDKLIGMLSIRDLLKAIIDDQKFTIDQLQKYITG